MHSTSISFSEIHRCLVTYDIWQEQSLSESGAYETTRKWDTNFPKYETETWYPHTAELIGRDSLHFKNLESSLHTWGKLHMNRKNQKSLTSLYRIHIRASHGRGCMASRTCNICPASEKLCQLSNLQFNPSMWWTKASKCACKMDARCMYHQTNLLERKKNQLLDYQEKIHRG